MAKSKVKEEPTSKEVEFISPEEIWARNEYIFVAKKDTIETKIYKIDGTSVEEKQQDMKISEFDIFFPKEEEILYFVLDEVVLLFGKNFSDKSLSTLVGILNKIDAVVVNILKPSIKDEPDWFPEYVTRIETVAENMEKFLGNALEQDPKSKK